MLWLFGCVRVGRFCNISFCNNRSMRVWGTRPFQNSAAMDWLGGLASGLRLPDLGDALRNAAHSDEDERAQARAAVALAAAALGALQEDLPETAKRWLGRQDLSAAESLRAPALNVAELLGDAGLSQLLRG